MLKASINGQAIIGLTDDDIAKLKNLKALKVNLASVNLPSQVINIIYGPTDEVIEASIRYLVSTKH